MTRTLVFVTGNTNKLREVKAILEATSVKLESQDLDVPEIQGSTQEVAIAKCRRASELLGGPCITEDTALIFKALGGLPGPYAKWFVRDLGLDGMNKILNGFETRDATAICTFAYSPGPGEEVQLFEGRAEGRIVPARGADKFGWDPIFEHKETGKTFAELDPEVKNKLSHRYHALVKLQAFFSTEE